MVCAWSSISVCVYYLLVHYIPWNFEFENFVLGSVCLHIVRHMNVHVDIVDKKNTEKQMKLQ